uniref:Uncharacterized protein n=1 Tax=Magallana gigas TaxID=29159 RepID=K1RLT9_MAGGI
MKTPSVSTLIKRFDTGESNEPAGTTVTSPPRRVQTKAKSHHLQSAPLTQNKHISGAPPRSPSPFRKCTEPPQSYEPPIKPNESEHSYRESTTNDHRNLSNDSWTFHPFAESYAEMFTIDAYESINGGKLHIWKMVQFYKEIVVLPCERYVL